MLLEAAALILGAAMQGDDNDTSRSQSADQVRIAQIEAENREKERRHETTTAIVNGVFGLLSSFANE